MLENSQENVGKQYELLNILDGKASALLTFNAIALASISIWLGYVPLNYLHLALDTIFIAMLVSCAMLLRIVWIKWATGHENLTELELVRSRRTRDYRIAWRVSMAAVICLIAVSITHAIGTALIATGHCGDACRSFYSQDVFGNLDYSEE